MEGNNHDPDGQEPTTRNGEGIPQGNDYVLNAEHPDLRPNGHNGLTPSGDGVNGNISGASGIEANIEQGSPREVQLDVQEHFQAVIQTSSPIPTSQELYHYRVEHQERILRMAEASTSDESARRDLIVKNQTQIAWASLWVQALLVLISIAASAVLFWLTESPYVLFFLGVPVMQAIGAIGRIRKR